MSEMGPVSQLLARLCNAYALADRKDKAVEVLRRMEAGAPDGDIAYAHLALAYAGLGDRTRAVASLERAADLREADVNFIAVEPGFDGLRSEPRFKPLLTRLQLDFK